MCDVVSDTNAAVITRSIIALGQSLGLEVLAEGVETRDQRRFLALHGCALYQGYLFSRPVTIAELENNLLHSRYIASPGAELRRPGIAVPNPSEQD